MSNLPPRSAALHPAATAPAPVRAESTATPPAPYPPGGPGVPGTPIEVVWENEHFQPLAFHGIDVGTFKASTVVRPGESVSDAVFRLWCELNEAAMKIRAIKHQQFWAQCMENARQAGMPR